VKPSLKLVEDVPGERLVLAAPPSGVVHALRSMLASGSQMATSFVREIWQRPRSPRELLVSFGMVLLAAVLVALVLFASFMAVVGVALVVVLYVIGVWLVAWLLVPAVARHVIDARSRGRAGESLTKLSFARQPGEVSWEGAGGGRCAGARLSGMRVSIRSQSSESCEIGLQLLSLQGPMATTLRFSVASVDREEEAVDLCLRLCRVLGWRAFATTRDNLQALQIELRPAPPAERAHPFRTHAAPGRFHEIGEASTAIDWSADVEPGFREPVTPLPPFASASIASPKARVEAWEPGRVVELRAGRSVGARRILWGMVVASCLALMLPFSVLFMINGAGGLDLLETHQNGRLSFAGVIALLTKWSAGGGWLLALAVAVRRTGQKAAVFDWSARTLTIRDDDGRHVIPLGDLVEMVLTEAGNGSYALSAAFKDRAPRLLLESEPASNAAEPFLTLTVELSRALGVAWRCVSDIA
jgi:hypothetical protein